MFKNSYEENSQHLKPIHLEVKYSLGYLAVQIVSSKIDLSKVNEPHEYDALLRELKETIDNLHTSTQHLNL